MPNTLVENRDHTSVLSAPSTTNGGVAPESPTGYTEQEHSRVIHTFPTPVFGQENTLTYDPQIHQVDRMILRVEIAGNAGAAASFWVDHLGDVLFDKVRFYLNGEDYIYLTDLNFVAAWTKRFEFREKALAQDDCRLRNKTNAERVCTANYVLWIDLTETIFWFGERLNENFLKDKTKSRLTMGNAGRQSLRLSIRPLSRLIINDPLAGNYPTILSMSLYEEGINYTEAMEAKIFASHFMVEPSTHFKGAGTRLGRVTGHPSLRTYQEFPITQLTGTNRFVLDNFNNTVAGYLILIYSPSDRTTDWACNWTNWKRPLSLQIEYANVEIWHERETDQLLKVDYPHLFPHSKYGQHTWVISFADNIQQIHNNSIMDGGHLDHERHRRPELVVKFDATYSAVAGDYAAVYAITHEFSQHSAPNGYGSGMLKRIAPV